MNFQKNLMIGVLVSILTVGLAHGHPDPDEYEGPSKPASIVPVTPIVTATPVPASPKIRFHEMDKNGDRRISKGEWRGSARSFRRLDKNRDGVLSGSEVVAIPVSSKTSAAKP